MIRSATVAMLVFAVTWSPAASAQRAALADRVAVLEQRSLNAQGNADLLNQLAQLRTEVQALRAQLEELQQANVQLTSQLRARDLDLDSRLQRLEGAGRVAAGPSAGSAPRADATAQEAPAAPAARPASPVPAATAPALSTRRWGSAGSTPTGAELDAYNVAFDALKAGRMADASALFRGFLDRYPGGVYAPNALYWLGESYYATGNYTQALAQFEQLLERFATHDKAPGALLKIGLTRLGLRQEDAAEAAFAQVLARYPQSEAARPAADRLQALRAQRSR